MVPAPSGLDDFLETVARRPAKNLARLAIVGVDRGGIAGPACDELGRDVHAANAARTIENLTHRGALPSADVENIRGLAPACPDGLTGWV